MEKLDEFGTFDSLWNDYCDLEGINLNPQGIQQGQAVSPYAMIPRLLHPS